MFYVVLIVVRVLRLVHFVILVWFEVLRPSQQLWSCRDGPFCDIVLNVYSSFAINFPRKRELDVLL